MSKKFREPILLEFSNYVKPPIIETLSKEWVLNGKDNSFYNYLIERYNGSTTHASIINRKIELMYGKGLTLKNASNHSENLVKLIKLFPKKEVRKIISDFVLFGSSAFQVIKNPKGEPVECVHVPRQNVAPEKMNDEGDIEHFYFSNNWKKANQNTPERFDNFQYSSKGKKLIYVIEPYRAGRYYFADPNYLACLPYAQLEEEIANYSVNHIMNGFSAGYILNFNEGVPIDEEAEDFEREIKQKLTGSNNAGRFILSFNNSKENAPTIEVIPTNTSHEAWQTWVNIAQEKILTGHGVTSPMLFGIKDNTGLGNNADELKTAFELYMNTELKPAQEIILDAFSEVAQLAGISQEIEFNQMVIVDSDMREEPTTLSSQKKKDVANDSEIAEALLQYGEEESEDYELIFACEVEEDDNEEIEFNLARVVTGTPSKASEQDTSIFKIRYAYAPNKVHEHSREFCKKMIKAGYVYRKEDIEKASTQAVNAGWGLNGADTYSIWKFKGGGGCHHFWERRIYLKKNNKKMSVGQARKLLMQMGVEERKNARWVDNDKEVARRPVDMLNKGFVNKKV